MLSTKNPFPGMNPYLEKSWSDVHTVLIAYIRDAIGAQLPYGLVARSEESVAEDELEADKKSGLRSDVAVVESWRLGVPPKWKPEEHTGPGGIVAAEPEIIFAEELTERWVEIRTKEGKVVTIIEVISPVNSTGPGRETYKLKQNRTLRSGSNLVEIDLLRGGETVIAVPQDMLTNRQGTHGFICAYRDRGLRRELYPCPLRERLPVISIPLRAEDRDAVLDIQPLLDRCYELGSYWQSDYRDDPVPPLPPG